MIRPATLEDMPELMGMCRSFYEYAGFAGKGLRLKEIDLELYISSLISNDMRCMFVACEDDVPVGMLSGIYQPWFACFEQGIINEQWWFVLEDYRKSTYANDLLDAFVAWGKEKGAVIVQMAFLDTEKKAVLERYYRMKGFKYVESYYMKEI